MPQSMFFVRIFLLYSNLVKANQTQKKSKQNHKSKTESKDEEKNVRKEVSESGKQHKNPIRESLEQRRTRTAHIGKTVEVAKHQHNRSVYVYNLAHVIRRLRVLRVVLFGFGSP